MLPYVFPRRPSRESERPGIEEKSKGGPFEILIFRIFSNKEKHEKSGNFRNRDFATIPQSHNPTIPEFFPPAPQLRIWAAAAGSKTIDWKSLCSGRLLFSREEVRHHSRRTTWSLFQFGNEVSAWTNVMQIMHHNEIMKNHWKSAFSVNFSFEKVRLHSVPASKVSKK